MHSRSSKAESDWSAGLATDVWVDILARLAGDRTKQLANLVGAQCRIYVDRQAQYQRLRLVCRKFRDMLQQDQQLSQQIVLSHNFDSRSMFSFELWLEGHGHAAQSVVSFIPTQFQQALLELLRRSIPGLIEVSVSHCSSAAIKVLSCFSCITTCELDTVFQNNISALHSITTLRSLRLLHGHVTAAQLPDHLTQLTVEHATLSILQSCNCVTSLKVLTILRSKLHGLHDHGLPACLNLEALHCWSGVVCANALNADGSFSTRACSVNILSAASLSALSCMRSLSLKFGSRRYHTSLSVVQLDPLYALTSLATLRLEWTGPFSAPIELHSAFTALRKLSLVEFSASACDMVLNVKWQVMPKLHSLTLQCNLHCDRQLLGLSRLSALRCLDLGGCVLGNAETTITVTTLVYNMKTHCPDVKILLAETPSNSPDRSVALAAESVFDEIEQAICSYDSVLAEILA